MSRLKEIWDYFISIGYDDEKLKNDATSSVLLSTQIMDYAHRNQKRINREAYANHPYRSMIKFRELVNLEEESFYVDKDYLAYFKVPFDGVQEVCLMHDVIEDTDFTIDDIEEIFNECGFDTYFNLYIKDALIKITHIKDMNYEDYIDICMENPISAIAKIMDLQDNLNVLTLRGFNHDDYNRASRYLDYIFKINCKYKFLEKVSLYKIYYDMNE